ncbi:uncharacterized protein UBRO_01021 [Ustilago bromivora]|uniref:Uncharacterized protein n=1 Tax=Ustilago bromivora TaxID=307758 RepID=A0A1K0GVN2_9BASI|nr:uncharacterized protein UBRO_01021 [Ustilago bromivora]SYW77361.1 uncharacterized protein UBRO2_01820 [Ustilago bromivora]
MKLLPTFSVLLIAVQTIAAVQLDQLQQPRFVKVRRNLSNDAGSSETQRSLERRLAPELPKGVEEIVNKFEKLSSHSESQSKMLSDSQHLAGSPEKTGAREDPTHYFRPSWQTASMHSWHPSSSIGEHFNLAPPSTRPSLASETWPAVHENWISLHDQQLENHAQALTVHKEAIEQGTANILTHDQRLKSVEEALEENKKDMKGDRRGMSKGVVLGLGTATLAAGGTSIYYQQSSSKTIADMADRIQAQQGEINRLKALNGQQGGAMLGQGVAGTTGRGTSDGGLV